MEHQKILAIIRAKRDAQELNEEQLQTFVNALGKEELSEAQIGAFLMSTYLNGMTLNETLSLTKSMTFSGTRLEWPQAWKGTLVDKHATGGVGDKTSLVLAPALAACCLRVPMISGRSLGHTGGTLDKLEAIPGFNVHLSAEQILLTLESAGCCIVSQTENIVPADKVLYRLRDQTVTVESDGLVVASIISKKAAEGLDALVLDVKLGKGTLIKDFEKAKALAQNLVTVGQRLGVSTSAILSRMDSPLGTAVGNALEVAEAIDTMNGHRPDSDLVELVAALGGKLLLSTGRVQNENEGQLKIRQVICDGSALKHFSLMLIGQGCQSEEVNRLCTGDKWSVMPKACNKTLVKAESSGYVESIDAFVVGSASHALCSAKDALTKHRSGVVLHKKPGDGVVVGDTLLEVHHDPGDIYEVLGKLREAVIISKQKPIIPSLIHARS